MKRKIIEMEYIPFSTIDQSRFVKKSLVFLVICIVVSWIYISFPHHQGETPIVKDSQGQIGYESDKEICAQLAHGTPVHGANINQIETYCLIHG